MTRSEFERWDETDHSSTALLSYWFSCKWLLCMFHTESPPLSVRNQHAVWLYNCYSSLEPRDVHVLVKSFIFKAAFIVIGIYICCVGKFMYPSVWCKAVRNKWIVRAGCCVSGWNMSFDCSWLHIGVSFIKMNVRHKGQSEAHHSVLAVKPCKGEMTDSVI